MLEHEVGEAAQHASAVLGGARLPRRKRGLGRGERTSRLCRPHPRHLGDRLAGGGVEDGERLAGVGVDPRSVHVRLPPEQRNLDCGHAGNDNRAMEPQFVRLDAVRAFELAAGVSGQPLFGADAMLNLIRFEPGSTVPLHSHPHEQLGIVLEGMQALVVEGVAHELGPFEAYVLPGGVEHSAYCGPEGSLVLDVFTPVREDYAERWHAEGD